MRVALATCAEVPNGEDDERPLVDALASRGVEASYEIWDDGGVDWPSYELVVVRSAWDYAERRDAFVAWARSLPRVLNDADTLEWNTDKTRYLPELGRADVPVITTDFLVPGDSLAARDEPFVVKPSVSAGGRSSAKFQPDELDAARELVTRIHAERRIAMVQPFLGDFTETALVYIDGAFSHALHRRVPLPAAGDAAVLYLDESLSAAEPTDEERAIGDATLAAVSRDLLYARVDVAEGNVIELEVAEPSLYLSFGEGATDRFAEAIASRLAGAGA